MKLNKTIRLSLLTSAALALPVMAQAQSKVTPPYALGSTPTVVQAAPGFPTVSPEQIASDVTEEFNPRTGEQSLVAAPFDPFEQDPTVAASVKLRSIPQATAIDGSTFYDGAVFEMNFYYNSPSDDPYGGRAYGDAAFLNGELAPVTLRDNRILECSSRVDNVVYDHQTYYTGPHIGIYRPYRHYAGHYGFTSLGFGHGFSSRSRSFFNPGVGYSGFGFRRGGFARTRGSSSRGGFRGQRRDLNERRDQTERREDRRDRIRDRQDDRDNTDQGFRRRSTISGVRQDQFLTRGSVLGGTRTSRGRLNGGSDRAREDVPTTSSDTSTTSRRGLFASGRTRARTSSQRREEARRQLTTRQSQPQFQPSESSLTSRPIPQTRSRSTFRGTTVKSPAPQSSVPSNRGRSIEKAPSSSGSPSNVTSGRSSSTRSSSNRSSSSQSSSNRSSSRSISRSSSSSNSRPSRSSSSSSSRSRPTRSTNRSSSSNRSSNNNRRKQLNFFSNNRAYDSRTVVTSTSVDCAREETLNIFIPQDRLEAARFDGLTLIVLDREGGETPVFIPPNYIEGFRLAQSGQIRPQGIAPQTSQGTLTHVPNPTVPNRYPQPRRSIETAPCPTGTVAQSDGTCLQTGGVSYQSPRY